MNNNPTTFNISVEKFPLKLVDNKLVDVNQSSIFQIIRDIRDPEHPFSLEKLGVVE